MGNCCSTSPIVRAKIIDMVKPKNDLKMGYLALIVGILLLVCAIVYLVIIKQPTNNHLNRTEAMNQSTQPQNQQNPQSNQSSTIEKTPVDTELSKIPNPEQDKRDILANLNKGALLIDVRTPQEFAQGRFKSAINLSVGDMENGKFPEVAKDHKIYVHCRSANRSAYAARLLSQRGYTNVIDLGGLGDVQKLGFELVK